MQALQPESVVEACECRRAGVVPACGSIDCLSVFARTSAEGAMVATQMACASDFPADPTLRLQPALDSARWRSAVLQAQPPSGEAASFVYTVPADELLAFDGPRGADYAQHCKAAFQACCARCAALALPALPPHTRRTRAP